ncbi:MAG: C39 family peptidase [Vulcanimicrobiaceae bacterium]
MPYAQAPNVFEGARLLFEPVRTGVPSWNTFAPEGNLQFRLLRAHAPATPFVDLAQWHPSGRRSHSREDHGLRVETDEITSDMPFDGIELRADGVDFNLLAFSSQGRTSPSLPYARDAMILDVPRRSQYVVEGERGWCSPTSLAMVHAYHGIDVSVEETAASVFDLAYNGTGNWSFNVAFSGSLGLRGAVVHLENLDHAQRFIARNVPLVISYSWSGDELPGAPLEHSDGHLAVLAGFTANGDCAMNDPAAPDVAVVYPRNAVERIWQRAGGVAYAVAPAGIDCVSLLGDSP